MCGAAEDSRRPRRGVRLTAAPLWSRFRRLGRPEARARVRPGRLRWRISSRTREARADTRNWHEVGSPLRCRGRGEGRALWRDAVRQGAAGALPLAGQRFAGPPTPRRSARTELCSCFSPCLPPRRYAPEHSSTNRICTASASRSAPSLASTESVTEIQGSSTEGLSPVPGCVFLSLPQRSPLEGREIIYTRTDSAARPRRGCIQKNLRVSG